MPTELHSAIAEALAAAKQMIRVGDFVGASKLCDKLLRAAPRHGEVLLLLGHVKLCQEDAAAASQALRDGLAIRPDIAEGWVHLGLVSRMLGDSNGAAAAFGYALKLDPKNYQAMNGLGSLAQDDSDVSTAAQWFARASEAAPLDPVPRKNHAFNLGVMGRLDEAEAQFAKALAIDPKNYETRMDFGLFQLSRGDFASGWDLYEGRWRSRAFKEPDWGGAKPRWQGEALAGRSLLLWGEQGIGDQILHGTMLRDAIRRVDAAGSGSGHVIIAVTDRLVPLFERALADLSLPGITLAVTQRQGAAAAADLQCPFGSLGGILRRSAADFAAHDDGAYLRADPARRDVLRQRYQALAPGNRLLGVAWRSINPFLAKSKNLSLADLAPVFALPGITWVNLQHGDVAAEIAASGVPLHNDTTIDTFRDLDGHAAQLAALDGVVAISCSTVHLAAALGVRVDLLLPRGPGRLWYWSRPELPGAERSRWYKSVRLWHQQQPGEWQQPVAAVAEALRHG